MSIDFVKYFSLFVSNHKSAKLRKLDLGIYNQTYLWYNVNSKNKRSEL